MSLIDASAKAVLRQRVRALRRAFVREHPEADWLAGEIAERSFGLLLHGRAAGVAALYRASGSEIDPRPLAEHLLSKGWRLALPASVRLDAPVVFRAWAPGDRLAPDEMLQAAIESFHGRNTRLEALIAYLIA